MSNVNVNDFSSWTMTDLVEAVATHGIFMSAVRRSNPNDLQEIEANQARNLQAMKAEIIRREEEERKVKASPAQEPVVESPVEINSNEETTQPAARDVNEFALALAQDLVLEEEPIGLDSDETTYQAAYRVLWELSQEERWEVNELASAMEAEMASSRVESIKVGNITFEAVGLEPLLDQRRAFGPEGKDYGTEKVVPEVLDAVECSARWLHNINVLTASLKRGKVAKQKLLADKEVQGAGMAFQAKALWAAKAGEAKESGNFKLSKGCWDKWRETVIPAAWNQVTQCEEKLASLRARITQAWDGYWVAQDRLDDLVDANGGWYESLYKGLKGYNAMRFPTVTGDVNQSRDWNVPVLSAFEMPSVEGWKFLFPPRLQRVGRGAMDLDISEMSVGEWAVGSKPKLTQEERVARKAMIDSFLLAA